MPLPLNDCVTEAFLHEARGTTKSRFIRPDGARKYTTLVRPKQCVRFDLPKQTEERSWSSYIQCG